MDFSYQEKSIVGLLLATVIVYKRFVASGSHGKVIFTFFALIVIQIATQIAIAVASRPEPRDERDRLIETKAYRVGYFPLLTGTMTCMIVGARPTVNALLMALMAAEIGKSAAQLYYYRRSA